MPGLFALIAPRETSDLHRRVSAGAARLLRQSWHVAESRLDVHLGVTVVHRGGVVPGGSLWVSPSGDLLVAMDGEVYGGPSVVGDDGRALRIDAPTSSCGEWLGQLYRNYGVDFVKKVRGAFAILLVDYANGRVCLCNDRFGFRPIAYAWRGGVLTVSSSLAAVTAAWSECSWPLDCAAIGDWFTFEHVLGEKTYLRDVTLLPNAGQLLLDLRGGGPTVQTYWDIAEISAAQAFGFPEAVEEAARLFGRAVGELAAGPGQVGVFLTSGLDSRTTAGFLANRGVSFTSVTYGATGCRDMVWGTRLAEMCGSLHMPIPLDDGGWIPSTAEGFIAATESFVSCFHSHGISGYAKIRERLDVHLSGYGGGSFLGGDTTSLAACGQISAVGLVEAMYHHYAYGMGHAFRSPIELHLLLQPSVRDEVRGMAEASMAEQVVKYQGLRTDIVGDALTLNNRYKKMFPYVVAAERDYFEDRSPFMDYALLEFVFSLPTALRIGRKLQLGMLDMALPEIGSVPWQVTAEPATLNETRLKDWRQARRPSKWRPWHRPEPLPFEPGRNYPKWLREDCIDWARSVISSPSMAKHGVLNRGFLEDRVRRMQNSAGEPYEAQRICAFQIAAAVSFELMQRRVLG